MAARRALIRQDSVTLVQGRHGEDIVSAPSALSRGTSFSGADPLKTHDDLAADIVSIDLKLSSTVDLAAAVRKLEAEQAARAAVDGDLVQLHFAHIKEELESSSSVELSLEHLELFQAYLLRRSTLPKGDKLAKDQEILLKQVVARIKGHPLVDKGRSGGGSTQGGVTSFSAPRLAGARSYSWANRALASFGMVIVAVASYNN